MKGLTGRLSHKFLDTIHGYADFFLSVIFASSLHAVLAGGYIKTETQSYKLGTSKIILFYHDASLGSCNTTVHKTGG